MHALALEALNPFMKAGSSVLDVGLGSGYLSACIAEMLREKGGGMISGIDNSYDLVDW